MMKFFKLMRYRALFMLSMALIISACNGGGNPSSSSEISNAPVVSVGSLSEVSVENMAYDTATQHGKTDSSGMFLYVEGEDITFSIGNILLPTVKAKKNIKLSDLFSTPDLSDRRVVNLLYLLTGLDADKDLTNGAKIPVSAAANSPPDIDFNVATTDFSANSAVSTFIERMGVGHGGQLLKNTMTGFTASIVSDSSFVSTSFTLCGASYSEPVKFFFDTSDSSGNGTLWVYGGVYCKSGMEWSYQDMANGVIRIWNNSNEVLLTRQGRAILKFVSYSLVGNGVKQPIPNGSGLMPIQAAYNHSFFKNAYWVEYGCRIPVSNSTDMSVLKIQTIRTPGYPSYSQSSALVCPSGWTSYTAARHRSHDLSTTRNSYDNAEIFYDYPLFSENWDDQFEGRGRNMTSIYPSQCPNNGTDEFSYIKYLTLSKDAFTYAGFQCANGQRYYQFAVAEFTAPPAYAIAGNLSGLITGTVTLSNNGKDKINLSTNGAFSFPTSIAAGGSYTIQIETQPTGHTCSLSGHNGTADMRVSNVKLNCIPSDTYTQRSTSSLCANTNSSSYNGYATLGNYAINTNAWNRGTLTDFTTCVQGSMLGDTYQTGIAGQFDWEWNTATSVVRAYPSIIYRPLGKDMTPIAVRDVGNLNFSHDVEITLDPTYTKQTNYYNLAYDIWADSVPDSQRWPHDMEIMIKLSATWADGHYFERNVIIDGINFDVTVRTMSNSTASWKYISFNSTEPQLKADIRFKKFTDYMIAKGLMPADYYINGIEFGNEVARGKARSKIKSYSVTR